MLTLHGFAVASNVRSDTRRVVLRLSGEPTDRRRDHVSNAYLYRGRFESSKSDWVVTFERMKDEAEALFGSKKLVVLPNQLEYLGDGDIIRFVPGRNAI